MKSKLKKTQVLYHVFLILIICGLTGGFLFDLKETLPLWLKIILLIVVISYPISVIYSMLKIPRIEIKEDKIIEESFQNRKEVKYQDIKEISPSKFLNRIYKIGLYYSIESKKGISINIPYKMYSNEKEILQEIEKRYKT